ncbi:uncharacterized protein LOC135117867 [Helicoverpa armigera]|uniref:uncharacterized protein LOC135117867 n=1 Tax=Helicoverpa armigera TaxID=29058 RepID=UPI003082B70E
MTSQALFYILIMFLACSRDPLIYAQTTSTEVGRPVPRTTDAIRTNATMYAWSSWELGVLAPRPAGEEWLYRNDIVCQGILLGYGEAEKKETSTQYRPHETSSKRYPRTWVLGSRLSRASAKIPRV